MLYIPSGSPMTAQSHWICHVTWPKQLMNSWQKGPCDTSACPGTQLKLAAFVFIYYVE